MKRLDRITNQFAARTAALGGAAFVACGVGELLAPSTRSPASSEFPAT